MIIRAICSYLLEYDCDAWIVKKLKDSARGYHRRRKSSSARVASLKPGGRDWVDCVKSVHTLILVGCSFDELIKTN